MKQKNFENGDYLDAEGYLWVRRSLPADPFDPPGAPFRYGHEKTEFQFLDVPTYGWPLGMIYRNESLQFATHPTARRVMEVCLDAINHAAHASIVVEEVTVGPMRWADKYMIRFAVAGREVDLNAGMLAVEIVRAPDMDRFAARLRVWLGL